MAIEIEDYVKHRNAQLAYLVSLDVKHATEIYTGAVNNYNRFITDVGKDPGYPPPPVPLGPTLSAPDPSTGLVRIIENSAPVCDPLPVLPVPDLSTAPSNVPLIGKRIWPGAPYFQSLQQDSVPGGTRVNGISADGVRGVFEKIANPISGGGGGVGGSGSVHGVYLLVG